MKRLTTKQLFDSNRFVWVFALCASALCWVVVAMTSMDVRTRPINDVPVDIAYAAENLQNLGLNLVDIGEHRIQVEVRGQRTVVAMLEPEDIHTTVRISGITEPGTYDLPLTLVGSSEDYEIVRYNPSSVKVRFDRFASRTFEVETTLGNLTAPAGYALDEEYTSPQRVTVTGPQAEMDKVAACVVDVDFTEPIDRTYSGSHPVTLLDVKGDSIDFAAHHLSVDTPAVELVIPVLRIKELPFEVGFVNVPLGFPEDDLMHYMTLTDYYTTVAGPVNMVQTYTDLKLGYINLKELTPEANVYSFPVTMPSMQFRNLDGIHCVAVALGTSRWSPQSFILGNFQMSNIPSGYEVKVLTQALYNIPFAGLGTILEDMTADDIVVELDFSEREITPGQRSYPVKISAPTKGLVWSVGDHSVIVQITTSG